MDRLDLNRANLQKIQLDWFDYRKIQTDEQMKIISTVQTKGENLKSNFNKANEEQSAFPYPRNPNQEVLHDATVIQKLLEFSSSIPTMNRAVHTKFDIEEMVTSLQNQLQAQTFTGEEFDLFLSFMKKNPDNPMIKNAIMDVLRAFSFMQTFKGAENTIDHAMDELLILLTSDEDFQIVVKNDKATVQNEKGIEPSLAQLGKGQENNLERSISILKNDRTYGTYTQTTKEILQQIKQSVPADSPIQMTVDRILSAMKRMEDAQRFPIHTAVEKLMYFLDQSSVQKTDRLIQLYQKAIGMEHLPDQGGRIEQRTVRDIQSLIIANKLTEKAQLIPIRNEFDDTISLIDHLKEQYPQSHVIQTMSAQSLNGLTAHFLANQPILHFFLKSFLNQSAHVADVWIDPEFEEDNEKSVKVFLAIELDSDESFEVELMLNGKMLSAKVMCPESFVYEMQKMKRIIREQANQMGFSVPNVRVGVLTEKHAPETIFRKDCGGRRSFHAKA